MLYVCKVVERQAAAYGPGLWLGLCHTVGKCLTKERLIICHPVGTHHLQERLWAKAEEAQAMGTRSIKAAKECWRSSALLSHHTPLCASSLLLSYPLLFPLLVWVVVAFWLEIQAEHSVTINPLQNKRVNVQVLELICSAWPRFWLGLAQAQHLQS